MENTVKSIFTVIFVIAMSVVVASVSFASVCRLCEPSRNGYLPAVKSLLANGSNPNAAYDGGRTPLMFAALGGHAEVADVLLSAGANPNGVEGADNWTPLVVAVLEGHVEITEILLSAGANPNTTGGDDNWTPLIAATDEENSQIVKMLLSAGANPNGIGGVDNWTPLMAAARQGNGQIAKMLLSAGANTNTESTNGWTAMEIAERNRQLNMVRILEEYKFAQTTKNILLGALVFVAIGVGIGLFWFYRRKKTAAN